MKTNIKMKVTPEQSRKVQEIVFANGGSWSGYTEVCDIEKPYLFIYTGRTLGWGDSKYTFEWASLEQVSAELFIRTNGTCIEQEETKQDIDFNNLVGVYWETSIEDSKAIYEYLKGIGVKDGNIKGYEPHIKEYEAKIMFIKSCYERGILFDSYSYIRICHEYKMKVTSLQELKDYVSSLSNPTKNINTDNSNKEYLVYVQGKGTPKKKHDYDSAINEAKRLSEKEIGREVHVVEIVKTFQSKVIVEEI